MHIQSLLVPAILAIGASAGASRWCSQWSNEDNQAMKCYWEACGSNDAHRLGYEASDGSKIMATTRNYPASAQCNPQHDVYYKDASRGGATCGATERNNSSTDEILHPGVFNMLKALAWV
ncbi:hypothetical protein N7505_004505 [Penicillium chrysogenum]|uniref:Uncharacterized protein n=1 Tax=Penicillium chrysogenum TaxID=5076 RepID=A0ABQ8WFA2_PENCH|nr:hypothetical protein N7505_004505 [Penicillium chrysogenum]